MGEESWLSLQLGRDFYLIQSIQTGSGTHQAPIQW